MLALLGAGSVIVLVTLILLNRCSPLVALILVPLAAGIIGGFGLETGTFMIKGVQNIAPMAAMFTFAILFFGIMTDAGLLDPIIAKILKLVGESPPRIVVGTALLALLVHLDGSGAVCFMVVIPAMLPIYDKLGMDRRVLACAVSMAAGVNFLPWTGPVVRSTAVLQVPVMDIFRPMIPVQLVGLAFVFGACWWLGKREERRLKIAAGAVSAAAPPPEIVKVNAELRRPHLFWVNLVFTLVVMTALVLEVGQPAAVFMVGVAIALLINYPRAADQRARIDAHARSALLMAGILLAAGAFSGVMTETGALKALAQAAVGAVPGGASEHIPFGLSLIAMPLSMIFDPDSYYFAVMPVIAEIYQQHGGNPVEIAQASIVGQMTVGFPVSPLTPSTFLIAGLTGLELSAHQRFSFPLLYAASLCMALACLAFGIFSI